MRLILAIDPGKTTGWAIVADDSLSKDGEIWDTGNWLPEDVGPGLSGALSRWNYASDHLEAVVEKIPIGASGNLSDTLRTVVATVGNILGRAKVPVTDVLPGTWKTSSAPESERTWQDDKLTAHQRDAIRMARWYIRRHMA